MAIGQSNSNTAGSTLQSAPTQFPQAKKQGTGFTNLQKVIGANNGNQLGTAVQQGAQNRVGQIQNTLGQAKNDFNTAVQGNRVDTEANKQFTAGAIADPNAVAANDDNVKKFQGLLQGGYKGPTGIQNIDSINAQAKEAASFGGQAGSAEGRQALLQRYAGGNNYNQGQQRLDNLLLGQSGQGALKQVRRDANGLEGQVNNANSVAQAQATEAQNANKSFGQDVNRQLGRIDDPNTDADESAGAYGNLYKQLNSRATEQKAAAQGQYDRLQNVFNNTGTGDLNVDAETAALLGITDGTRTVDTDLSKFQAMYDPSNINRDTVATTDDYARNSALNKLSGRNAEFLTNKNLANTAKGVTFDKDQFGNAIKDANTRATTQEDAIKAASSGIDASRANIANRVNGLVNNQLQSLNGQQFASEQDRTNSQASQRNLLNNLQTTYGNTSSNNLNDILTNGGNARNYLDQQLIQAGLQPNQTSETQSGVQSIIDQNNQRNASQSALQQLLAKSRKFVVK